MPRSGILSSSCGVPTITLLPSHPNFLLATRRVMLYSPQVPKTRVSFVCYICNFRLSNQLIPFLQSHRLLMTQTLFTSTVAPPITVKRECSVSCKYDSPLCDRSSFQTAAIHNYSNPPNAFGAATSVSASMQSMIANVRVLSEQTFVFAKFVLRIPMLLPMLLTPPIKPRITLLPPSGEAVLISLVSLNGLVSLPLIMCCTLVISLHLMPRS